MPSSVMAKVTRLVWVRGKQVQARASWLIIVLAMMAFGIAFAALAGGQAALSVHAGSQVKMLASVDFDGDSGSTTDRLHYLRYSLMYACANSVIGTAAAFSPSIQPRRAWIAAPSFVAHRSDFGSRHRPPIHLPNT